MTGLDAQTDVLLEIAVIVTDKDLNILGEGPNLVIHQSDEVCTYLRWFKITKSLIFNIASEASYVYKIEQNAQKIPLTLDGDVCLIVY